MSSVPYNTVPLQVLPLYVTSNVLCSIDGQLIAVEVAASVNERGSNKVGLLIENTLPGSAVIT